VSLVALEFVQQRVPGGLGGVVRIGPVVLHRRREWAILDTTVNEMLRASQPWCGPDSVGLPGHVGGHRRLEDWHMLWVSAVMRCRGGNVALWGKVSEIHGQVMIKGTHLLLSWCQCTHINWYLSCRVGG